MSFADAITVLAERQLANEAQRQDLMEKAERLKPQIQKAIGNGQFDRASELLSQATTVQQEVDAHDRELERYCPLCGGSLVPFSINWHEGLHIDGCEGSW